MPKFGQMRIGASWMGEKEPDITAAGNQRFYDIRCRTRIPLGATVRGTIAKSSTFQVWPGNGHAGSVKGVRYQRRWKYFRNIGAPGSNLENWQGIFASAMLEVKNLTEEQRAPYRAMETEYRKEHIGHPRTYRALCWQNFYLMERLPVLYPGY